MNEHEQLIAEARTIAKHSAVSLPEHADCLRRLADALEAATRERAAVPDAANEKVKVSTEDDRERYKKLVTQAFSHLGKGETLAPPPDRPETPLDSVVRGIIEALRAETRLYPETYAWIISDAVQKITARR